MDALLPLFLIAMVGGWLLYRQQATIGAWSEVASTHNLQFTKPGFMSNANLAGVIDDINVQVYTETRSSGRSSRLWTILKASHPLGAVANIRGEGMVTMLRKAMFSGEDVQLGSEGDDAALHLTGDDRELVALLNPQARHDLRRWIEVRRGTVVAGDVVYETAGAITSAHLLNGLIRQAVDVAAQLRRPDNIDDLLGERCVDPNEKSGVRIRALELMQQPADACRQLLREPTTPPDLARQALRIGSPHVDVGLLGELLARPNCPAYALRAADNLGHAVPAPRVLAFLQQGGEDAREAAQHIQRHPDPAFEGPLLDALAKEDANTQESILAALGVSGTLAAVEFLLPISNGHQHAAPVQAAARKAISTLQSAVDQTARGGLTVSAQDAQGGLSTAGDKAGALSRAKPTST